MHFYYLDEAGCTGKDLANAEQPIFVLGGLSVRDEGWNKTQQEFQKIIANYFSGSIPTNFELHAVQLLSPNGDGPFSGHDRKRRNDLAKQLLGLLAKRRHDVHLYAIDKARLEKHHYSVNNVYDSKTPYLIAYDYMLTHINWFIKEKLGKSARAMLIIDAKKQFEKDIERITHYRRFETVSAHRVKWIVEFSYPVDSRKNPMVQLSDLIVFCAKKFLEVDGGYRNSYPNAAKTFFAECYQLIDDRITRKKMVMRKGRGTDEINEFLNDIRATPKGHWKKRYGI